MALSVTAVSISVSPLVTEEVRDRHVDDVGAQPLAGDLERALGAGGVLEEQVHKRLAGECVGVLNAPVVELDVFVAQFQERLDVEPVQASIPRRCRWGKA